MQQHACEPRGLRTGGRPHKRPAAQWATTAAAAKGATANLTPGPRATKEPKNEGASSGRKARCCILRPSLPEPQTSTAKR